MHVALREYQSIALHRARLSAQSGHRAILLVSPTGSGKTVMLSAAVWEAIQKARTVNWYAHRRELTDQAARTIRSFGLEVAHNGANQMAPIHVNSVQGALASGTVRDADLNIFDEAHHFAEDADDWHRLIEAHRHRMILGATATPQRGDGAPLSPPFTDLIVVAQVPDLVRLWREDPTQGLVPTEVIGPNRKLKSGKLAQCPVRMYQLHGRGRRNVVFASHIPAAEDFASKFVAEGIEARVITGKTSARDRSEHLARFAAGELRVLINVYVLTEGWDCPATGIVTLARSVGSASMYMQTIGRGMRPFVGKDVCTVFDLNGAYNVFGSPEQEWDYSLDGEGMTSKSMKLAGVRLCRRCGTPIDETGICPDPRCARDHSQEMPEITGDPVSKFAFMRSKTPAEQLGDLARWIRQKREQGKRGRGHVIHLQKKFLAVFGRPLKRNEWQIACELSKEPPQRKAG